MKTNLDSLFKTDGSFEKDGIWMEISDKTAFKVKRFGGRNSQHIQSVMARLSKPYTKQIEMKTLSEEKDYEITVRLFVETCLVDWKGVEIDGEIKPFEKELAVEFFTALPDLLKVLINYASDLANYKEELGN